MEKEYKLIIISIIIAFLFLAASFILISKDRAKSVEIYVGNLCNKSQSIHVEIFHENHIFMNKNLTISPNKVVKYSFLINGKRDFIVMAKTNYSMRQKRVKGWMISITIISIKNKPEIDIEGIGKTFF